MSKHTVDEFTQDKIFENGGHGAFDRLVHIGEENLRVEYEQGRITGSDYAQAHTALLQICYQIAAQYILQSDQTEGQTYLLKAQKELAKAQAEQAKAQTELAKKQLEIAEEQLKQAKLQNLLVKQKIITEQAQTRDYVDKLYGPDDELYNISSEVLSKPIFDVDGKPNQPIIDKTCQPFVKVTGVLGKQKQQIDKSMWATERDAEFKWAKLSVLDVFNTMEQSETVGPQYFGLNASNAITTLNKCRVGLGIPPITTTINGQDSTQLDSDALTNIPYSQRMDKWFPKAGSAENPAANTGNDDSADDNDE